jgi:hypothetical protein
MSKQEKVALFNQLFTSSIITADERIEIDFAKRGFWLTDIEEMFLRLFGAKNIYATAVFALDGSNELEYKETDNLNTSCCGIGTFVFNEDVIDLNYN